MRKSTLSKPTLILLVGSWHLLRQIMAFGNPTASGFSTMGEALMAVAELNRELMAEHNIKIHVSGHLWHEIRVSQNEPSIGYSSGWNNVRSIALPEWIEKSKKGEFAPIGRIIPPGFGIPGADYGAFINPDPKRRKLMHDMMVHSFIASKKVKAAEAGLGNVIYWTGPDGIRWRRLVDGDDTPLGYAQNPELEEWKLIVDGVSNAIKEARDRGCINEVLLMEGKPAGDPCYLDVFTDTRLEIKGIYAINEIVGASVAEWQGEFCHSRGSGIPFNIAMKIAIDSKVFGGRIHLNSGGLASVDFSSLLAEPDGTPMSEFQQYVDNDFLPGQGVKEWVEDQVESIKTGTLWSARTGKPFEIEFDARFCREPNTIEALRTSALWTIDTFNEAAKAISNT